jgi:hypothetical protein
MLTRSSKVNGVKLPFLSLGQNTAEGVKPAQCGHSGYALAFTTLRDAGAYLQAKNDSSLELEMIVRPGIARYLDDLQRAGFVGVGFDTTADDDGAVLFTIDDLRAMIAQ